jgi:hypothetical protein
VLSTCERAKVAGRTQRGKLQKVRQGRLQHYQWVLTYPIDGETGEVYVVDEEKMIEVRRISTE